MAKKPGSITIEDYDLNLTEDYVRLEKLIDSGEITLKKIEKDTYLKKVEGLIKDYCDANDLDFPLHFGLKHPIPISSKHHAYERYLGLSLMARDVLKIPSFLDYQMAGYQGKFFFPSIIEYGTYIFVKQWSAFDNTERLAALMKWVEKNRKFDSASTNKTKTIKLDWTLEEPLLKKLSKELKSEGYTKKPTDFENVFTKNAKTGWLKDPQFLAYLLYKLAKDHKAIRAEKKGHFKASTLLFSDSRDKVARNFTKNYLKDLSNKITTRNPKKYESYRGKIDSILKYTFGQ